MTVDLKCSWVLGNLPAIHKLSSSICSTASFTSRCHDQELHIWYKCSVGMLNVYTSHICPPCPTVFGWPTESHGIHTQSGRLFVVCIPCPCLLIQFACEMVETHSFPLWLQYREFFGQSFYFTMYKTSQLSGYLDSCPHQMLFKGLCPAIFWGVGSVPMSLWK